MTSIKASKEVILRAQAIAQEFIQDVIDQEDSPDMDSLHKNILEDKREFILDFMMDIQEPNWKKIILAELTEEQIELAWGLSRTETGEHPNSFGSIVESILVSYFATEIIDLEKEIENRITELVESMSEPFDSFEAEAKHFDNIERTNDMRAER